MCNLAGGTSDKVQSTRRTYLLGAGDGERPRLAISSFGLHEIQTNFTKRKRFYDLGFKKLA